MIPQNQGRRSNIQRSYINDNPETVNSNPSIPNSSDQRKRERICIEDKDDRYNRKRRTEEKVYIKTPQIPTNNTSNNRPKERSYIEPINESLDVKSEKTNVAPFQQQINTTKSRPKERQYVGSTNENQFADEKAEKSNVAHFQQQTNTSNRRPTERAYVTAITENDEQKKATKTNEQQQPHPTDSECIIF